MKAAVPPWLEPTTISAAPAAAAAASSARAGEGRRPRRGARPAGRSAARRALERRLGRLAGAGRACWRCSARPARSSNGYAQTAQDLGARWHGRGLPASATASWARSESSMPTTIVATCCLRGPGVLAGDATARGGRRAIRRLCGARLRASTDSAPGPRADGRAGRFVASRSVDTQSDGPGTRRPSRRWSRRSRPGRPG